MSDDVHNEDGQGWAGDDDAHGLLDRNVMQACSGCVCITCSRGMIHDQIRF